MTQEDIDLIMQKLEDETLRKSIQLRRFVYLDEVRAVLDEVLAGE